ncbi:unnamed protein product [Diamesa serratosioi]
MKISLFKLPFKNPHMMDIWLEKIPREYYSIVENPSYICENHFEERFITTNGFVQTLDQHAIPTIFNMDGINVNSTRNPVKIHQKYSQHNSNCRFCLKQFPENDPQVKINEYIFKQFYNLTGSKLRTSDIYSKNICEKCFLLVRDFSAFKNELLENQQKLYTAFADLEDHAEDHDNIVCGTKEETTDDSSQDPFIKDIDGSENVISDENNLDIARLIKIKLEVGETEHDNQFFEPINVCSDYLDNYTKKEPKSDQQSDIEDYGLIDWGQSSVQSDSEKEGSKRPKKRQKIKSSNATKTSTSLTKSIAPKKICQVCGKSLSATSFKRHYNRVHLREKNYQCDICLYRCFKKYDIENHLKSHLKIKTHHCDQCTSSFTTSTGLRAHQVTHSNYRPFKCDLKGCEAAFKSREILKKHIKAHLNQRDFHCDKCDKSFRDSYKLKRHQKSHNGPDLSEQQSCEICGKIFYSKESLASHQIYHKDPEFKCTLCEKLYYKKTNLLTHVKTHTGKKGKLKDS